MKKMRGITLIALIITIIVMLILVGVTVTTAINGGLFKQAQKAKTRHEEEYIKEQIQIALVSSIDERLIKYDKAYLEKLGIDTKAYDEFEQMGYHVGAGGNVNLLVLKGELEKIFANKIQNGEMKIRTVFPINGYTIIGDDELGESYNDFFDKCESNEENEIRVAATSKALLDLATIEIEMGDKVFAITSAGETIVETIGEETTNGEIMSIRDASRVFKYDYDGKIITRYIGKEKTVKIPKCIGTEVQNVSVTQLGKRDENGKSGSYNDYWYSLFQVKGEKIAIKEMLLTKDNDGNEVYLDFKEENFEQIVEILGLDSSNVSDFNALIKYMHAYQEDGEWYTTYIEQEDGTLKFIDKSELSGVEIVVIPESVVKVCNYALAGDPFLTKVYIPASLISQESADAIGSSAFEGASSNLKIYITTPEGWGETQKNAAISKFDGFRDLTTEQFIWSDEEGYINP